MANKRIGEILVEKGYLKQQHLDEGLAAQTRPGEKRLIGQILISRGYVKPAHIKIGLALQGTDSK